MELRRRIIHETQGSPLKQKAVAFAIFIKQRLGRRSAISNFSVNKLHTLTGLSATTIKKYLPQMFKLGLVSLQGRNKDMLVFYCLHSKTKHRNIIIDKFKKRTFKEVYKSLRTFIFMLIQAKKDSIKHLFQSVANPKNLKEYKRAKKTCKQLANMGIIKDDEKYNEYGLTYKKIAEVIGCCVSTAQKVVKEAIKNKWVRKQNNIEYVYMPNVWFYPVEGFSFTTRNYACSIYPNTYTLPKSMARDINGWWYSNR